MLTDCYKNLIILKENNLMIHTRNERNLNSLEIGEGGGQALLQLEYGR